MKELNMICPCGSNKFRLLGTDKGQTDTGEDFVSVDLICTECREELDLYVKENLDHTIVIESSDTDAELKEVE